MPINNENKVDLSFLADRWPSAIVSRERISDFSGGLVSSSYLANLDCVGKGPVGAIRFSGRKIAYPVESIIRWLENRAEKVHK